MSDNSVLTSEKWVVTESLIEECIKDFKRDSRLNRAHITMVSDVYYGHWIWNVVIACDVVDRGIVAL